MQQSKYSVFHNGNTPIQLGLLWQSHTPVSVPLLKLPLGVIDTIPLKPLASSLLYKTSSYTVIC